MPAGTDDGAAVVAPSGDAAAMPGALTLVTVLPRATGRKTGPDKVRKDAGADATDVIDIAVVALSAAAANGAAAAALAACPKPGAGLMEPPLVSGDKVVVIGLR